MFRLILMRHAKSDWTMSDPDHDRPLNTRGAASAAALGRWMAAQGLRPDQALVSSSRRTRETFDGLGLDLVPDLRRDLYHADPDTLWETLRGATGHTVLILGHNPGLVTFAGQLCAAAPSDPEFMRYPTGATLVSGFDITGWNTAKPGMGRALDFVVPRALT